MIDPITEYILEQESMFVNEGLLTTLNKVFVLFGFGAPADPRVTSIFRASSKCKTACYRAYRDTVSTRTKTRTDTKPGKMTDEQIRKEREETIQTVQQNPERGKCLIMCHYDKLKQLINAIEKNKKNICNKNMNVDLCNKWVARYLPDMKSDLKALENAVRLMKGAKEGDNQKIKVVVNTLKKVL